MFSNSFPNLTQTQTVWEYLLSTELPIYLYGTGDGADKIIAVMDSLSIPLAGIFVSEDFFRGQCFHHIPVTTLSRLEASLSEFIIVVAFGSHLPEILNRVKDMAAHHPLVIPDVPVYGDAVFDRDFALSHASELEAAYALLADDQSKQVFKQVLQYKLNGRLSPLLSSISPKEEVFSHLLRLGPEEDYLDLGAYRGDTIQEFLQVTDGRYHSITALEPDPRSFRKLTAYAGSLPHVRLLPYGISAQPETICMQLGRGRGSAQRANGSPSGGTSVQMTSVDALQLSVSYLKMDIEGYEAAALSGSAGTLLRQKPKLNIACYHRSEDLYRLPLLIHQLQPSYQIYMRRHACLPCWDLNLYCL